MCRAQLEAFGRWEGDRQTSLPTGHTNVPPHRTQPPAQGYLYKVEQLQLGSWEGCECSGTGAGQICTLVLLHLGQKLKTASLCSQETSGFNFSALTDTLTEWRD